MRTSISSNISGVDEGQAAALIDALRRMRLIADDEIPRLCALTGGVSSVIALAHTRAGPVCIKRALAKLKVAADWFAPVERNLAEAAWMKVAASVVPAAVPRILGEDAIAMAFAMEYLDPARYPVWKAQLREGSANVETARAVGAALVAIHNATAGDAAGAHPECADALRALLQVTASTKRTLVHGDVSPKNILVGPTGPIFLDAECAWYGDPAFDLAFCLNHLLLKSVWAPDHAPLHLASFDALAAVYLAHVGWEPPATMEARAARLLPGLLLARIDGKSPVEYLQTADDRARVREFATSQLADPVARLETVRARWAAALCA
jgi:tRNA A-37 threonylcarbamoyl transferase component Bud32